MLQRIPATPNKARRKTFSVWRLLRNALALLGVAALALFIFLLTPYPYRALLHLSSLPPGTNAAAATTAQTAPTHLLLMGGGSIPSQTGLMRTYHAARLAKSHPDALILLAMPETADASPDTRAYLAELHHRGIPAERIHILSGGRNTREQAIRLVEYLDARLLTNAVIGIVTSPEHIRRTAAAIHKLNRSLALQSHPAWPESIDDTLDYSPADLAAPGQTRDGKPAAAAHLGRHTFLRYDIWNNLQYLADTSRETTALAYYKFLDWI